MRHLINQTFFEKDIFVQDMSLPITMPICFNNFKKFKVRQFVLGVVTTSTILQKPTTLLHFGRILHRFYGINEFHENPMNF